MYIYILLNNCLQRYVKVNEYIGVNKRKWYIFWLIIIYNVYVIDLVVYSGVYCKNCIGVKR